jgi:hypothetical protein
VCRGMDRKMSEPLTIYECPEEFCGAVASVTGRDERTRGRICVRCGSSALAEVVIFRGEDVRSLWLALVTCHDADVLGLAEEQALDAFPAPEDWR